MVQVRDVFCAPDTAQTLCVAPFEGGRTYNSTLAWCTALYNETSCEQVRNDAEASAIEWGGLLMFVEAIVCLGNIGLILFSLYLCYKILTYPVITQSMNDIMNFLLVLPLVACGVITNYLW